MLATLCRVFELRLFRFVSFSILRFLGNLSFVLHANWIVFVSFSFPFVSCYGKNELTNFWRVLYVATELRAIKNEEAKRHVKFRIQSLLFSSLTSHPMPSTIHAFGAQPMHSQWDSSHTSTPSDGWISGPSSRHSISPYASLNEDCADTYHSTNYV